MIKTTLLCTLTLYLCIISAFLLIINHLVNGAARMAVHYVVSVGDMGSSAEMKKNMSFCFALSLIYTTFVVVSAARVPVTCIGALVCTAVYIYIINI